VVIEPRRLHDEAIAELSRRMRNPRQREADLRAQLAAGRAGGERVAALIERFGLDTFQAGLRETLDLVREGRALVEYCAGELEAVGRGLEELRLDELVERLEPAAPGARAA